MPNGAGGLHLGPEIMTDHYRDHAANERTFLAWVRTGITVMVLGFMVEKFEIFLASLQGVLAAKNPHVNPSHGPELISLALVLLGVAVIVLGYVRFSRVQLQIESRGGVRFHGTRLAMVLTLTLLSFGIYLLLYLARIV